MAAVWALTEIGPGVDGVTSALIATLGDRNPAVREAATNALRQFGPLVSSDLCTALSDHPTHTVRAGAARALSPLAASDAGVMSSLIEATSDRSSLVRRVSVEVIGRAGPSADRAVPALIDALLDEEPDVRRSAAEAIGLIGPAADDAIPALTVALGDSNARVAAAAREALAKVQGHD
jgi:HEAT repeat protein